MCNPLKYINESIPGEKKKGPSEYNLETGKCTQVNFNIKSMYFGVCVCVYKIIKMLLSWFKLTLIS